MLSEQAHRGGLAHAVGWGTAIVTAGMYGTITAWPEAELRSIAEAAGFVLPQRPPQFAGDAASARLSISEVCRADAVVARCHLSVSARLSISEVCGADAVIARCHLFVSAIVQGCGWCCSDDLDTVRPTGRMFVLLGRALSPNG